MPRWAAVVSDGFVLPFNEEFIALFLVVLSGFCLPLMFSCSSCLLLGFFSPFFWLSMWLGSLSFAAGFVEDINPPSSLLLSIHLRGKKLLVMDMYKCEYYQIERRETYLCNFVVSCDVEVAVLLCSVVVFTSSFLLSLYEIRSSSTPLSICKACPYVVG